MWSEYSDYTVVFPNMNNMDRSDIGDTNGMKLVMSINVLNSWMMNKSRKNSDDQKKLLSIPYFMPKNWNILIYVGK